MDFYKGVNTSCWSFYHFTPVRWFRRERHQVFVLKLHCVSVRVYMTKKGSL